MRWVLGEIIFLFDMSHALAHQACSGFTGQTDVKRLKLWVLEGYLVLCSTSACQL